MKRTINFSVAAGMAAMIILMTSCKETSIPTGESSVGDLQMLSQVEKEVAIELSTDISDELIIEEILDEVIADLEEFDFLKSEGTCPIVTIDKPEEERFPRVVTKDYGEGCTSNNGIERSGKIIITIYGRLLDEGSVRTVTFEDYTRKGVAVSGNKEIICMGLNEDSLYVHAIRGEIELVKHDTLVIKRKLHKRRTMLAGFGDKEVPNEWLIEGRVEVTKSNGVEYEMKVKEPLHRIQGCRWFQAGVKKILFEVDDKGGDGEGTTHQILIDYGYAESEDACDNLALRTVDDEEPVVIELK